MSEKWDKRYLKLAYEVSKWSLDPSSKIGAVFVGSKGQVLSQGYNGLPRGMADTYERLNNRELKYKLIVHAEANAIYNASFNGVSLDGSTVYVYGLPTCSECAKALIQVGVKRVVMPNQKIDGKWLDSWIDSAAFLVETGVAYDFIDFDPND